MSNNFVPYKKTDFFFYSGGCSDVSCGVVTCNGVNYDEDISSTTKDTQLCLNKNLYDQITKIQVNHGGADQRYTDLTLKYYGDMFSVGYSIVGICIMFGMIKYA